VESLYNLAINKDKIEFLFRVDTDDLPSIDVCNKLTESLPNARRVVDRRGQGYADMHHWINFLCKLARGDWLFVWNDDARMTTPNWDHILLHTAVESWHTVSDVCQLDVPAKGREGCYEFSFLRRSVVDILGHYALSPHTDNWLHRVMDGVRSVARVSQIEVEHLSDKMDDQTRKDSVAAYDNGELALATLDNEASLRGVHEDCLKLLDYIKTNTRPA
jgi:hypothetical protein